MFCVVGGIDKIRGNRHGYGEKFDEAFEALKPMAISMIGVTPLAPVLQVLLEPIVAPFYSMIAAKLTAGILALLLANLLAARVLNQE